MTPSSEMSRILSLGRGPAPAVPDVGVSLLPAQVDALAEWVRALSEDTCFGPPGGAVLAGVGAGKTLIGLLLPHVAQVVSGRLPRTTYLVPASLRDQLLADRTAWAIRGARVGDVPPDVLTHESLSAPSGRDALRVRAPDLLVIDEAHGFADPTSARWRRVVELLQYRPDTRLVVMSGSLSWRSLLQCRHLLLAALRGWCPLPATREIEHWASVIDVHGEPSADDRAVLDPLVAWAGVDDPRAAYRVRLRSCPGVTVTAAASTTSALRISRIVGPFAPTETAEALHRLEQRWELPDGTPLVSVLEYARHAATLALGAYRPRARGSAAFEAARSAWASYLRTLVLYQPHRYQSPSDVVEAAEAGRLGAPAQAAWDAWQLVEEPTPDTRELVWLDQGDHLRALVRGYHDETALVHGRPYVVWTQTPEVGERVAALLGVRYFGAGSGPPTGHVAVASIRVHGKGWAGAPAAGYADALVLEPPSSGHTWEQLLGRLHRTGAGDEVRYVVYAPGGRVSAIYSGVNDARYARDTLGADQRLLLADWSGISIDRTPTRPGGPRDPHQF